MRVHLSKAEVTPLEEEYVMRALRSGWIAPLGPDVEAFELEVAAKVGVASAVALNSGTAALHLGLLALGVQPGSAVVVSTMTFAATANAIKYIGARPVFVDSTKDGNIDPLLLAHAVDVLQSENVDVAAAVVVDLFGRVANYQEVASLLNLRGVPLLEDAAEALGASHQGCAAGSFGRAAAFSFNGNKIMTTSGGGMLVSNDENLISYARHLSTQARQPVPWYEHSEVGYNYRLSNILAALGRAQLARLDDIVARKTEIFSQYREALREVPGVTFLHEPSPGFRDNYWLTCIKLDPDLYPDGPARLIRHLEDQDIEARHLWKPMHMQPIYSTERRFLNGTSEELFRTGLALPSGTGMSDSTVDRVSDAVISSLRTISSGRGQ